VAVRRSRALAELRTMLTGVDPGLIRLRLASIGTASMVLATAVMSGVRALSGQPVTVELFAAVLAMISNLAVNEPDVKRTRVTTLLMLGRPWSRSQLGRCWRPTESSPTPCSSP
jgi:hypothetical protein